LAAFQINGVELFYTDSGGAGRPVVFSHGFGMDHTMFDSQVNALANDYRVITWDQRAWGSSKASGPFNLWDSANDLLALLDHLRIRSAVFVGMSQGGFVSIRAALLAPNRVEALVLIGSQSGVEARKESDEMIAVWREHGAKKIQQKLATAILGPGEWPEWFSKWGEMDLEQLAWAYSCLMDREDVTERLGGISCPALVIHGTDDQSIAFDKARIMERELGGATTLVAIGMGSHAANISHPSLVNEALLNFLRGLSSAEISELH
jgi:3-oxoadipate enol-lactonase